MVNINNQSFIATFQDSGLIQPNNYGGNEDCAVLDGPQYLMHDRDCTDSNRVFCQTPPV